VSGVFKVAELANTPKLPTEETLTSHRTRSHDLEVDLFMANEVIADKEFIFLNFATCDRVGKKAGRCS